MEVHASAAWLTSDQAKARSWPRKRLDIKARPPRPSPDVREKRMHAEKRGRRVKTPWLRQARPGVPLHARASGRRTAAAHG